MPKIRLLDSSKKQNIILDAVNGTNLLEFLRDQGFFIESPCGGHGTCGKCTVSINGKSLPACRISITEDITVELPTAGIPASDDSGLSDISVFNDASGFAGSSGFRTASGSAGSSGFNDASGSAGSSGSVTQTGHLFFRFRTGLGAAVDLGTTTIAVSLYDLSDGRLLGSTGAWNTQISYGADVITRIQYCMDRPRGLSILGRAIRRQIRLLIQDLMDIAGRSDFPPASSALTEVVIAGNTIMQHIFADIDPSSIAIAPFLPRTKFQEEKTYSFPEFRGCRVYLLPCVAGYVGGDITSGLFACKLIEKDETSLFLDIGTNGEMALKGKTGFTCCSVASGPAFEGAEITCGMRSIPGAISHISYMPADGQNSGFPPAPAHQSPVPAPLRFGDFYLSIVGGPIGTPKGLCGSALIDLLAILLKTGVVDETGRLVSPSEAPEHMRTYMTSDANDNGIFWLNSEHTVCLRPEDVRQLQLAKAAVAAGIHVLTEREGITCEGIDHIYIAGSFGQHLNAESAATIGMIPKELKNKVIPLGNTSLSGAIQFLSDPSSFETLLSICRQCNYVELSLDPGFSEEYINQMIF